MENALQEVDEDYECQSISKVTPFTYTDSEGNSIVYYGNTDMLVSRGVGNSILPFRINNRPEVILIELQSK